jgi:glutamine amidotransferase
MIVIVDYGMGNLGSIANMLNKIGAKNSISSDTSVIEKADKLILSGVGSFSSGMKNLSESGLISLLNNIALHDRKPILGLCLGMQLFTKHSEEGDVPGLGWIDAKTVRFRFEEKNAHLKIPHMGWNTIVPCNSHPLFDNMDAEPRYYFVHSYHVVCSDPTNILAYSCYGYDFAAMIIKENVVGAQFHPEKSHKYGMRLLKNFVERI